MYKLQNKLDWMSVFFRVCLGMWFKIWALFPPFIHLKHMHTVEKLTLCMLRSKKPMLPKVTQGTKDFFYLSVFMKSQHAR